jgi:hypothetical protein
MSRGENGMERQQENGAEFDFRPVKQLKNDC